MISYMLLSGSMSRGLVITADAAIEMLKTHKLFNQLSFHTERVAVLLKFVEAVKIE